MSKLANELALIDRLHYGQNFEKSSNRKIYYHSIEEHPKISKIAKFGCECGKCKPVKIANFVYFCITHEKLIPTSRKRYQFSVRNTKVYKNRKICKAIFSSFYNISRPNFAILLILGCSSMPW